ncbi:hypothetical protein A3L09_00110 [Thermococcus profundus]|uniref:Peptidase S26 domain-containing protein n=1 Tax=Thermococcus profundus TaxID=49899 RepID=A0A2Z2M7Y9_THEPR|nr:signal peptidase I [Thermococcus profundus]ASJ01776.1 hypothetical protein A3L09_00110 [Thermococcus profundus]
MKLRAVILLLLISPFFLFLPHIGNLMPMVVLSGSMEPLFNPGDMVILEEINGSQVSVGDVVAFHPPNSKPGTFVTHRVIEIVHQNGTAFIRTKGDNNEDPDGFLTPVENVRGRVIFSIPYLGYLTKYNSNRKIRMLVYLAFTLLPGIGLVLSELPNLIYYSPRLDSLLSKLSAYHSRRRERIIWKRFLLVSLGLLVLFTFLLRPQVSAMDGKLVNSGSMDVVVLTEGVKDYEVLHPGDEFEGQYTLVLGKVLPVLWIVKLYEINPFILRVLNIAMATWGALLLHPLWLSVEPKFKLVRRRNKYALRRL